MTKVFALALILLTQATEPIPFVERSSVADEQELTFESTCPSGWSIQIRRYGYSIPRRQTVRVLVRSRTVRGADAERLSEILSVPETMYRFHIMCDQDRQRAWLSIDMLQPAQQGGIDYLAASVFFSGERIVAYNSPRNVPVGSFWQQSTAEDE
jgi:hypothetical protein